MLRISQTCLANVPMGRDVARPQSMGEGTAEPATSAVPADVGDVSEDIPSLSGARPDGGCRDDEAGITGLPSTPAGVRSATGFPGAVSTLQPCPPFRIL
jgi:hypothetical protein